MFDTYFFVKSDYKIQKISIAEIVYIESMGDYVRFFLDDKKVVTLLSLSNLISILPKEIFLQIHRSYIINLNKVNFIQNNIISIGKYQLPISKSRKKELMEYISLRML
jgi:DNA-binding LytR/AlgR family response regulator